MKNWVSIYARFTRKGEKRMGLTGRHYSWNKNKPPETLAMTMASIILAVAEFAVEVGILSIEQANEEIQSACGILKFSRLEKI